MEIIGVDSTILKISYFIIHLGLGPVEAEAVLYPKGEFHLADCSGKLRVVATLPTLRADYKQDWKVSFWDLKFMHMATAWDRARAKELFVWIDRLERAKHEMGYNPHDKKWAPPPRKCEVS